MNYKDDIPWNGHCVMFDGVHKTPMTKEEAKRKSESLGLYNYKCKYCNMHHFSSEKGPRSVKKKKN